MSTIVKPHKVFCRTIPLPDNNGSYLVLPVADYVGEIDLEMLCWSNFKLADGRTLGIGRGNYGITAIHIPSEEEMK